MRSRGHTLRLTAVSALVVLSLTGFSSGRGHGHGHGYHSGGSGGCSSSSQDHDSSSSTTGGVSKDDGTDDSSGGSYGGSYGSGSHRDRYDTDDDQGGGSGTSTPALRDATARLVSCATPKAPYATVEVTSPNGSDGTFAVTVSFRDAGNDEIVSRTAEAEVPAYGKVTVRVPLPGDDRVARTDHCALDPAAPATS
ncbi:hypothetical protein ACF1A5_19470 [Streptomyces sp. NPDC014864]|uniref:hypothetical protein n=1 Tax=Streptomyces sp. NPDC014864 TaxID=3364924 RepID=UPI0036F7C6E9